MNSSGRNLKIVFVGPKGCGKSTLIDVIVNFKGRDNISFNSDYNPTAGCRILEFSLPNVNNLVEIWDCSGDQSYDASWPAFLQGASGSITSKVDAVCLCYRHLDDEDEIKLWYDYFVRNPGISDHQCLVIALGDIDKHNNSVQRLGSEVSNGYKPKFLRGCSFITMSPHFIEKTKDTFIGFMQKVVKDLDI